MPKSNNYRFFDLPKEFSMADYREAIACIIDKYSKSQSLTSIYNWGNPSIPGISDIDLVFVFKDNSNSSLPFLRRSFYILNQKLRYLVVHPFIFIDESSFQNARYIYPDTNFKLLHGKNIKIRNISAHNKYYSDAALLNDIIIRHYPRDFLEQSASKTINARDTLLRLNSLKYSLKIIRSLTGEKYTEWNGKLKLIENLRENWFKSKDFGLLASLNEDAAKITMEIIEKFLLFLTENNLAKIVSEDNVKFNGIKNKSLFIKNWTKENALKTMLNAIKLKQEYYSVLPLELSAQLVEYSKGEGRISKYIKSKLSNDISYNLKHKDIIKERIKILNKQAELAFKLRHSDFAAFFDFGYRNKSGINNWILNILDIIRF